MMNIHLFGFKWSKSFKQIIKANYKLNTTNWTRIVFIIYYSYLQKTQEIITQQMHKKNVLLLLLEGNLTYQLFQQITKNTFKWQRPLTAIDSTTLVHVTQTRKSGDVINSNHKTLTATASQTMSKTMITIFP